MDATGWAYAHIAAQTAVAAGFTTIAIFVVPRMRAGLRMKLLGFGACVGSAFSHMWWMTIHPQAQPVWVLEHAALAALLWAIVFAYRHPAGGKRQTTMHHN